MCCQTQVNSNLSKQKRKGFHSVLLWKHVVQGARISQQPWKLAPKVDKVHLDIFFYITNYDRNCNKSHKRQIYLKLGSQVPKFDHRSQPEIVHDVKLREMGCAVDRNTSFAQDVFLHQKSRQKQVTWGEKKGVFVVLTLRWDSVDYV